MLNLKKKDLSCDTAMLKLNAQIKKIMSTVFKVASK